MASKRRIRRKQCQGKIRHVDMESANKAAFVNRRNTGEKLFAYGCKFCGGFHIGHQSRKQRKAMVAKAEAKKVK